MVEAAYQKNRDAAPLSASVSAKVLVIDDDEHFRALVRNLLAPSSIEVIQAVDARDGLTRMREDHAIDAVVVDIVLPDQNGIQVLRQIKKMRPKIKAVAVSGAEESDFCLGLSTQFGADAVLPKSRVEWLSLLLEKLLEPSDRASSEMV